MSDSLGHHTIINLDAQRVMVFGQWIHRPSSTSPSEWYKFWEDRMPGADEERVHNAFLEGHEDGHKEGHNSGWNDAMEEAGL